MTKNNTDITLAVQLELRHGLREWVRKFPSLTTHEAQARARTWRVNDSDRNGACRMRTYLIVSSAGVDMGQYSGATPADALDAMARDAGYRDQADAAAQGMPFDGSLAELQYRIVVGEKGNDQGHIVDVDGGETDARAKLVAELEAYGGDGWGRIEFTCVFINGWYPLE